MKYKIVVLYIALSPLWAFSVEQPKLSAFEQKLEELEHTVAQADINTAYCQQSTNWHFPAELYCYIESARDCYKKGNKKQLSRANQYIQLLNSTIDQAIEGEKGYWAGFNSEIWIDPVPPVPDCALQEFVELKDAITTLLSSSVDEMLVASQE
ncbi:hypothetical protein [uncultured Draconibacterium sp.]|uniref:hypothetical protein n=1 Tax=uncultured Draconibacterium sp. TaxID=1573823 RepID=UPI0026371722|nr:hypothetical protein [uncultured Draconibacterium sp.]